LPTSSVTFYQTLLSSVILLPPPGNGILKKSVDRMTEEADSGGFLSHSTDLSLGNSLPSFQEYAPRSTLHNCSITLSIVMLTSSGRRPSPCDTPVHFCCFVHIVVVLSFLTIGSLSNNRVYSPASSTLILSGMLVCYTLQSA